MNKKKILAIELKDDGDTSDENKAKLRFAEEHFARLNRLQRKANLKMLFLSPESYDGFFAELIRGRAGEFVSGLQASLKE